MGKDRNPKRRGRKARSGMRRYWTSKRFAHHIRQLRQRLSPQENIVALSQKESTNDLFLGAVEDNGLTFLEIVSALNNPGLLPWEHEMALRMFGVWLAAPKDHDLHRRALLGFVRVYAERLERTKKSVDLWSHGFNTLSARLKPENEHFYTGIYQDVGGLFAVVNAEPQHSLTTEIRRSATWMFEALIGFNALHVMAQSGDLKSPPTYRTLRRLVSVHKWRPQVTGFDSPAPRHTPKFGMIDYRQDKTMENNLSAAGLASVVAYAAYQTPDLNGGTLLDTILGGTAKFSTVKPLLDDCLPRARYVYENLMPRTLRDIVGPANGLPKRSLPLAPMPEMPLEDATLLVAEIHKVPGRPRSR